MGNGSNTQRMVTFSLSSVEPKDLREHRN